VRVAFGWNLFAVFARLTCVNLHPTIPPPPTPDHFRPTASSCNIKTPAGFRGIFLQLVMVYYASFHSLHTHTVCQDWNVFFLGSSRARVLRTSTRAGLIFAPDSPVDASPMTVCIWRFVPAMTMVLVYNNN